MVEVQTIIDLLTPLSITAGVIYYVMVLRNQNKTRQIQLLLQLSDDYTEETTRRGLELIEMEWNDYDEFERKYGSDNNPDNYAKRMTHWNLFNTQGMLLMNGLVDSELLFGSGRVSPMFHCARAQKLDIPITIPSINTTKIIEILVSEKIGPYSYLNEIKKRVIFIDNKVKHQAYLPTKIESLNAIKSTTELFNKIKLIKLNLTNNVRNKIYAGL